MGHHSGGDGLGPAARPQLTHASFCLQRYNRGPGMGGRTHELRSPEQALPQPRTAALQLPLGPRGFG